MSMRKSIGGAATVPDMAPAPTDERLRQAVREQMTARGWGPTELARRAGVSQTTISRFLNDISRGTNLRTSQAIAAAFGMKVGELLGAEEKAGSAISKTDRAALSRLRSLGLQQADELAELLATDPEVLELLTIYRELPESPRRDLVTHASHLLLDARRSQKK